jgi:hypothetical protein
LFAVLRQAEAQGGGLAQALLPPVYCGLSFYSYEGIWDLVGNNMPVFFIQDAIKFPDLIHAVKPEPNYEIPQATSAHDTFWDFVSLTPESAHMLMWVMSDRALPRSRLAFDKMNEQVRPGWQKCRPQRVDRQKACEQEDHDADHRSEDRNIIEQEGNRSP